LISRNKKPLAGLWIQNRLNVAITAYIFFLVIVFIGGGFKHYPDTGGEKQ
jgi:hypothetical protein